MRHNFYVSKQASKQATNHACMHACMHVRMRHPKQLDIMEHKNIKTKRTKYGCAQNVTVTATNHKTCPALVFNSSHAKITNITLEVSSNVILLEYENGRKRTDRTRAPQRC